MKKTENKLELTRATSRIEAFSDGVFAIAITLLILEIHVPEVKANQTLFDGLLHEWPSFLALLIGFFTLLVCWINHHHMFSLIHKSNSVLSLLNGFKLLVVTITPFSTALLAKNIGSDWEGPAVTIYCFNFALMGLAMTGIWIYGVSKGFANESSAIELKANSRLYIFASILSAVIWLVSFISIIGCMALFVVMFIIFVFPERIIAWQVKGNEKSEMRNKE
jgi:uncharacterized membrane protein